MDEGATLEAVLVGLKPNASADVYTWILAQFNGSRVYPYQLILEVVEFGIT